MAAYVFKVDTLVHNLKELQQEKSCLGQKLNELRTRRRGLESTLETVNNKYAQIHDTNQKMLETLKVAEHKVAQTQSQANSLESSNKGRRNKIGDLNKKTENEKRKQLDEVHKFEKELRNITSDLQDAKHFFTDDNLEEEIHSAEDEMIGIKTKVERSQGEIDRLGEDLNKMTWKQNSGGDSSEFGISLEDRKEIWKILQEENSKSCQQYAEIKMEVQELINSLQRHQEQ